MSRKIPERTASGPRKDRELDEKVLKIKVLIDPTRGKI